MDPLNQRTVALVVAALAALLLAAAPALAEESTTDQVQDSPVESASDEALRAADEAREDSIVLAYHETWDHGLALEETAWRQEVLSEEHDDPFRVVHRKIDSPFDPPRASPIPVESGSHAATVMDDDATYPPGLDARLVSPTLDLRYVRGISQSPSEPWRNSETATLLADVHQAYRDSDLGDNPRTGGFHYLLVNPPAGWFPAPCGPLDLSIGTTGACSSSLASAGKIVTGEPIYEEGTIETPRTPLVVPNPFPFSSGSINLYTVESRDVNWPGTRQYGLYVDDGEIHAPNPADHREGLSYINLTFWHKWELARSDALHLEVREKLSDDDWSSWRVLEPDEVWNAQEADPSTRYHEEESGDRTMAYNGRHDDHHAFVGASDGLVASTFNLNRYAGTEIQVAWRIQSDANFVDDLGWFVDDVTLWTNTYQRDVGVRTIDRPADMDRISPTDPFRPSMTVRNYGHLPMHDVDATFRVTPEDEPDEVLWEDTQTLDVLDPQEEIEVTATEAFGPPEGGSYDLHANLTPYSAPDDPAEDNLTHRPETTPRTDNNDRNISFQVQSVPRADVDVSVHEDDVQTDVGEAKTYTVRMENTGNEPLGGAVEVTATRLDRETLEPLGEGQLLERIQVREGELPHGKDLTILGSEDNTWARSLEWSKGLQTPGVYRIEATFQTPLGAHSGDTTTAVRATPAAYYAEDADETLDVPFDERSVYSVDMAVQGWTGEYDGEAVHAQTLFPDPVSRDHVWLGRGDDGGVGFAAYGRAVEGALGIEDTVDRDDDYRRTEPDGDTTPFESFNRRTQDTNYLDHSWLTRDVNLTAYEDADEVRLTFWHTGEFAWEGRSSADEPEPDRARGLVEVLPNRNVPLGDPAGGVDDELPDPPDEETGVDPVDRRTPDLDRDVQLVPGDALYANTLASFEEDTPWTRETVDLTPWKGEHVTLRFHLETTAARQKTNASEDAGHGALTPWLVDNVELAAETGSRTEVVFEDDVEGDSWEEWSSHDGFQVDDPRYPAAVAEGRGWDRHAYGDSAFPTGWHITSTRKKPEAGTLENSPMLRWGDPKERTELPPNVNVSVLRTPTFHLDDAREPALSFLQNYTFPSKDQAVPQVDTDVNPPEDGEVTTGASVWIVGTNDAGEEIVRDLLEPADESEGTYTARIWGWYSDDESVEDDWEKCREISGVPGGTEIHCETPLQHYPDAPNVFTGRSGRAQGEAGEARWERAVFDLTPYATGENATLDYRLEFHAINQRKDKVDSFGWLVDDIRVTERTFANDMAVEDIVEPVGGQAVGPGLQVPVAVRLENRGLYDQLGVQASYLVRDLDGNVVFGPVEQRTDPAVVIPGALNEDNPDKTDTLVFQTPWATPVEEGTYVLETRVDLSEALPGHAFPDDNPANDVLRQEVEVSARRSVGILSAAEQPDAEVVDPFIGTKEDKRSFTVLVENRGTLPEVFTGDDTGDFSVSLEVRDETGTLVETDEVPIQRLRPGEVRQVDFRNAWDPNNTGVFEISLRVNHPNETVGNAEADNVRTLTYTVFEEFLPRHGRTLEEMFRAEDAGWFHQDGAWHFGHGDEYRPGADDSLVLEEAISLRSLRDGAIRVNHSYAFEEGYDGGLLEVKPSDGDTWLPVPPQRGPEERPAYPVNMTPGSPLADPSTPSRALSGTSGADGPEPVETVFDIGAVDELTFWSTILEDDLSLGPGEESLDDRPDSVRLGDWSTESVSRVEPHSGSTMLHSNHTAVEQDCWKTDTENSGGRECSTDERRNDQSLAPHDSRKYLNITFNDTFPEDRVTLSQRIQDPDVENLRVKFWDYRAIGTTKVTTGGESKVGVPNGFSVRLDCQGPACPDDATVVMEPADPDGYDDNYRDWTVNVYEIPRPALEPFMGPGKDVTLSFVHHLLTGPGQIPSMWSTDAISGHPGWFLDDISVELVDDAGRSETYWFDDLEGYERSINEALLLQYDDGDGWTTLDRYTLDSHPQPHEDNWTLVPAGEYVEQTATVPADADEPVALRWVQPSSSGADLDHWALDDVRLDGTLVDSFDSGIPNEDLWDSTSGTFVGDRCGAASGDLALVFGGTPYERSVGNHSLEPGTSVTFQLKAGAGDPVPGVATCERPEDGVNRSNPRTDPIRNEAERCMTFSTCNDPARQELLETGMWHGDAWNLNHGIHDRSEAPSPDESYPRLLWDPVEEWGKPLWRHVEPGDLPCGPLLDGEAALHNGNEPEVSYPEDYRAEEDEWHACGPTRGDRDRAGGERLITDLNLRPAVGNATLEFSQRHHFRTAQTGGDGETRGLSGGRVEVSVDGGQTWIPLEPIAGDGNHHPMLGWTPAHDKDNVEPDLDPETDTHTTIGGRTWDPEGNSPYGIGGKAFTGTSGLGSDPRVDDVVYDLSRFAGRDVKLAWHAYFGTHNATGTQNNPTPHEFWAIDNVTVRAEVFDGDRLDLRLRAATDGTEQREGWTIHDLEMAGVETDVNVGAEILGIPPGEPVEAGPTSFAVALENKGEVGVPVDVSVHVTEAPPSEDLDEADPDESWTEENTRLDAESSVVRTVLHDKDREDDDLETRLDAANSYRFEVEVEINDTTRRKEAIRADNRHEVTVPDARVLDDSVLVVDDVQADPNNLAGDVTRPLRVETAILNEGFQNRPIIRSLDLSLVPADGGEPVLTLDEEDLEGDPSLRFQEPFQTRDYAWEIPAEDVADLPDGLYDARVQVEKDGDPTPHSDSIPVYVGPGFFQDLAYKEAPRNTTLDNHERCDVGGQGQGGTLPWGIRETNHSRWRSFGIPTTSNAGSRTPGSDPSPISGTFVCEVENLDSLGDEVSLSFFTRYSWETTDEVNRFQVVWDSHSSSCTAGSGTPVLDLVDGESKTTPRFEKGGWVQESVEIPEGRIKGDTGCISFHANLGPGGFLSGAFVDDIIVSPFDVDVSPDTIEARVQDDTVKRYPIEVHNPGGLNDTYRFAFVDATGEPVDVPRSWDLQVESEDGEPIDRLPLAAGGSETVYLRVEIPVQGAGSTSGETDLAVTAISLTEPLIRDTTSFEFAFDYPPRPDLAIIGSSVNNPDLAAGQPRSVTVTVANVGSETAREVPVEIVDTMPARFGEAPQELTQVDGTPLPNITLSPGQTTTIIAGWTPGRAGPHNLTVRLDPGDEIVEANDDNNVEILRSAVESAEFPDLEVDISVSDDEPQAGSDIDVNATITNNGRAPATGVRVNFRVGVSDLLGGDPPHILEQIIQPGETVELDATWPASFPGDYQAFVKAFPLSGVLEPAESQDDNLAVEPVTVRSEGLQLEGPDAPIETRQGATETVPVALENRGDEDDTVDLVARSDSDLRPRVTRQGVSVSQVDAPRDSRTNLTLEVRLPGEIAAGTYEVTVAALSGETPQREEITVPVTVVPEPGLALTAGAVEVDPGGGALPLDVHNTGNAPTTVNVTARDLPDGWAVEAPPTSLEPFARKSVDAQLVVPTDAPQGVRDITVAAASEGARDEAPVRVDVGTRAVLDVALDPADAAVRPGETITWNATLASVGNAPAYPDLAVEAPDDWEIDLPRSRAQIPDGETLEFAVAAHVPADAGDGDHTVRLVARGAEETFAGASDVGVGVPDATVTNVEQNPRVNVDAGETVTFTATVRNTGSLGIEDVGTGLYVDDGLVAYETAETVPAGGKAELDLEWTAEPGEHVILLIADPSEEISEEDEGNNARLLVVQVGGGAEVFGDVERAVPHPAGLAVVAILAGAMARRWRV